MRSRYSAHVLGRIDYLVATHDAETRTGVDRVPGGPRSKPGRLAYMSKALRLTSWIL